MRVFTLFFPLFDNAGADLSALHLDLKKTLCRVAGGFTMTPNLEGGWMDPESGAVYFEPVCSYRVAFEGSAAPLLTLADQFGALAAQLAVYVEVDGIPQVRRLDSAQQRKAS